MTVTNRAARPEKGLPHLIHEQLRSEILNGTLAAGAQLRQEALAERFSASRIPVREALRQLEAEGLVTYELNRGAVVTEMSVAQICEMLEVRIALECHAARLGVPNMVQHDFQTMQDILDAYSASEDLAEWAEYNRRFHLALCAPANNRSLRRLIEQFCLNTDRYAHLVMSLATGKDAPQHDHYQILDACRARDADRVAQLLEQHIVETRNNLLAAARQREDG
jgi:DNA-binding GntR family transcriptional regulator